MKHQKRPMFLFDSWGVGTWWDRWMMVHLLSGVILGLLFRLLGVGFLSSFWVGFSILALWEVAERVLKLYEPFVNIVLDLVLGAGGIWAAYRFVPVWGGNTDWLVLIAVSLVNMMLSYAGWTDSRRKAQYRLPQ